jgi:hypothetical protein
MLADKIRKIVLSPFAPIILLVVMVVVLGVLLGTTI